MAAALIALALALAPAMAGLVLAAPPGAQDDAYSTPEDTPKVVDAPGVLANDDPPAADKKLCVASVDTTNLEGSLEWSEDGSFTYTPTSNYNGAGSGNSFTYATYEVALDATTCDGAKSTSATVHITVTPVNDPPTAQADAFQALKNTTLNISAPGVLSNDTDIDGDSLTADQTTDPAHGVVVLAANGSFSYTPSANFTGSDSFSYRAYDGHAYSAPKVVTITVSAIPPISTPTPPPTPTPSPPTPGETLTPILTPEPDATVDPDASPTEFVPPTPQLSGAPAPTAETPTLAPGATPPPASGPTGEGGDSTLMIVLVVGLLALLVGFGAAVYGPRWLEARRAGRPMDDR